MFCREAAGWKVEDRIKFGPNMMSFLLTSGMRRWYILGAYMPLNYEPDVHCVDQTLAALTKGV